MIETPVIAVQLDVGVDVKLDRIEFLTGFLGWNENCKRGDSENK